MTLPRHPHQNVTVITSTSTLKAGKSTSVRLYSLSPGKQTGSTATIIAFKQHKQPCPSSPWLPAADVASPFFFFLSLSLPLSLYLSLSPSLYSERAFFHFSLPILAHPPAYQKTRHISLGFFFSGRRFRFSSAGPRRGRRRRRYSLPPLAPSPPSPPGVFVFTGLPLRLS